ncbi:MAG: hypothetical protein AAF362_11650 [Pseudomonadota bacterium]
MRYLLFAAILIVGTALSVTASLAENPAKSDLTYSDEFFAGHIILAADEPEVGNEATPSDETEIEANVSNDQLDPLFAQLKSESRASSASRIARQIVAIWNDSGSDSINLLMQWASEAMGKKQYTVAQDLLAHVTVLKPDYAEGWNRRATLYFMMSDYGKSLSDIEQTLRLEPRHFGALSGLAAIMQKTRKDKRALDTWYRVLDIYPANRQAQKTVIDLEEKLSGEGI